MIREDEIVKKIKEKNQGLTNYKIEQIVKEVIKEIEKEVDEELGKTVMGTD